MSLKAFLPSSSMFQRRGEAPVFGSKKKETRSILFSLQFSGGDVEMAPKDVIVMHAVDGDTFSPFLSFPSLPPLMAMVMMAPSFSFFLILRGNCTLFLIEWKGTKKKKDIIIVFRNGKNVSREEELSWQPRPFLHPVIQCGEEGPSLIYPAIRLHFLHLMCHFRPTPFNECWLEEGKMGSRRGVAAVVCSADVNEFRPCKKPLFLSQQKAHFSLAAAFAGFFSA